ncbi:MAG: UDP-N-acetylmuramoyl-L-alanine--D-glutamate ligase [Moraxellaceae bacterium]|nr:MAG: UDP-N-acetylmuramoyl-L-alanine--D-glutamate ligase [Moraxellaceae bacterium]
MSQIIQKVVVGLGKTGLSCARFLCQQGFAVAVTDSRDNPPGLAAVLAEYPGVVVSVGAFDQSLMLAAEELVVSPGVSLQEPAVKAAVAAGVPAIGDIELFSRYIPRENTTIVAITGSNAKSTVTTLVGDMIQQAGHTVIVAGNIGLPVMDILLQGQSAEFYVLELSSFQLETTYNLKANVATILNLSPDHLDRYDGMQGYIAAKQRIYSGCDTAIANADDQATLPTDSLDCRVLTFTSSSSLELPQAGYYYATAGEKETLCHNDNKVIDLADIALSGGHNLQNAIAALTIGQAIGLSDESMAITLSTFSGLAHRCQIIAKQDNVAWINDSKGTNTGATIAALNGLGPLYQSGIVLIAGGVAKGADFSQLVPAVSAYVSDAVLIGADAKQLDAALNNDCDIHHVDSLALAVDKSRGLVKSGGAVLLSPACASFDMFSGFEDRGNQFIELVNNVTSGDRLQGGMNCA